MHLAIQLLACLTIACLCQVVPNPTEPLSSLYRAKPAASPVEQKAMEYLLLSYPLLGNYSSVTIRTISRGRNPFALQDVYFTLDVGNSRISVIATLSETSPGEFISISPLVTTIGASNSMTTFGQRAKDNSNFYIISDDQIKVISAGNQTRRIVVPGGFQRFNNSSDSRLERAEAFIDSLHPQMINYSPQQVTYQVVSGINYHIQYLGNDGLTAATALVMVNLDMQPYLLGFQVHCATSNSSSMALQCTEDLAYQLFSACESLLLVHPEILAYEMISMVSDDTLSENGVLFILTYQNLQEGTRAMAELNIFENVFRIMSFYIYSYP